MENPITAEKVRKGTRSDACLIDMSSWLCPGGLWLITKGKEIHGLDLKGRNSSNQTLPHVFILFYFNLFLSLSCNNLSWSELESILVRVVNRGEMSALYWM